MGAQLPLAEAAPSSPSLPIPVNTASGCDGFFCGYLSPSGVSFMIAFLCLPHPTQHVTAQPDIQQLSSITPPQGGHPQLPRLSQSSFSFFPHTLYVFFTAVISRLWLQWLHGVPTLPPAWMLHEIKTKPVFPHIASPVPNTEPDKNPVLRCVCMNEIHTWGLALGQVLC